MRRVPAGSFARLTDPVALWVAWTRCRAGRRRRADVARFDLDADRAVLALSRALRDGSWRPGTAAVRVVREPKARLIAVAPIPDRIVHQAVVGELGPHYARSFIDHSFGCLEGRGPHRAALAALGFARRHRFRLHLDVARYFASVRHDVLLGLFERRLRDAATRALLAEIVAAGRRIYDAAEVLAVLGRAPPPGVGIPVGSYLSHFSGALYLDGLDHFIKREQKSGSYLRYMDDMLLFGDDRAALQATGEAVAAWLAAERGLALKTPVRVLRTTDPFVFLGAHVSRAGLRPSRKATRRLRAAVRAAAARGPGALTRTLASYRGLVGG